eukprot:7601922-Heterocapsa_arctica.AAC.1
MDMQTRGRWGRRESLARYRKSGRYLRQLRLLSAADLGRAKDAAVYIRKTANDLCRRPTFGR